MAQNVTPIPESPAEETAEEKATRMKAIEKARTQATSTLIENYKDEHNALIKSFALEAGYEWSPRKTAAERAADDLRRLIAEHPEVAKEVIGETAV